MSMATSLPAGLRNRLMRGAAQLDIKLSDQQADLLMGYLELLHKWNRAYNLTAIRDPSAMVDLHLLDSLAVQPHLGSATHILDVGTGPGLPGMVLAALNPQCHFTLLDSNGKKTRFMFQARTSLGLENVTIVNDRVEAYHPDVPFDMIASRAFASLSDMVTWCRHLLAPGGCYLAMKGQYPQQELEALPADVALASAAIVEVPGVEGQRHLLRLVAVPGADRTPTDQ